MRAPWDGGLDQVVLTIFSIWDRMRLRFSLSWATTVRLPTLSSGNSGREKRDCFIRSHSRCTYCWHVNVLNFLPLGAMFCTKPSPGKHICTSASCLLTVEAKVFGEGLSHEQLKALGDKVADGPGVFIQTARREPLIGRVKEHEQVPPLETQRQRDDEKTPREHSPSYKHISAWAKINENIKWKWNTYAARDEKPENHQTVTLWHLWSLCLHLHLHDLCDLLPLLLGRVGAGGVVCAGVEDEDGAFWSILSRKEESLLNDMMHVCFIVTWETNRIRHSWSHMSDQSHMSGQSTPNSWILGEDLQTLSQNTSSWVLKDDLLPNFLWAEPTVNN